MLDEPVLITRATPWGVRLVLNRPAKLNAIFARLFPRVGLTYAVYALTGSTLASAAAYVELLQQAKLIASLNFNPIEAYTAVAVVFSRLRAAISTSIAAARTRRSGPRVSRGSRTVSTNWVGSI